MVVITDWHILAVCSRFNKGTNFIRIKFFGIRPIQLLNYGISKSRLSLANGKVNLEHDFSSKMTDIESTIPGSDSVNAFLFFGINDLTVLSNHDFFDKLGILVDFKTPGLFCQPKETVKTTLNDLILKVCDSRIKLNRRIRKSLVKGIGTHFNKVDFLVLFEKSRHVLANHIKRDHKN